MNRHEFTVDDKLAIVYTGRDGRTYGVLAVIETRVTKVTPSGQAATESGHRITALLSVVGDSEARVALDQQEIEKARVSLAETLRLRKRARILRKFDNRRTWEALNDEDLAAVDAIIVAAQEKAAQR